MRVAGSPLHSMCAKRALGFGDRTRTIERDARGGCGLGFAESTLSVVVTGALETRAAFFCIAPTPAPRRPSGALRPAQATARPGSLARLALC